jgi:OOP family OmpA-OmpF porin
MLKSWKWVAGLLLLGATGVVTAAGEDEDTRWYISPSIGAVFSDGDFGPAGVLGIGRSINNNFGFELEAGYSELDVGDLPSSTGKYERITAGMNLIGTMGNPSWGMRPFLLANLNAHTIDFLGETLDGGGVALGGGLFIPMSKRWDLRVESRYNLDFISKEGIVPEDTFYVWTATVGARAKFGADPGDDDGDGVLDRKDKCPEHPARACRCTRMAARSTSIRTACPITSTSALTPRPARRSTPSGCPFDSDGDGIPDHLDQCPGTPTGVRVDSKRLPAGFSDGDGVPDYLDKLPGDGKAGCRGQRAGLRHQRQATATASRINLDKCPDSDPKIKVGPDGCPLDSDGDGIPDYLDECPNTPPGLKILPNGCALVGDCRKPRAGEAVDAKGCALDQRFILRGVKFEFDSDKLTKSAELILNDVADTLAAYPDVTVEVQGHTDSLGTDAYNLGLSERRAISVKRYLDGRGVNGNRLRPVGYGESAPIASDATPEGQEENRRVEFRVVGN